MELIALYKRVIGLDVHQAQITACALIEEANGSVRIEQRQFGAPPEAVGDLSASHCFVLDELMRHLEEIAARIAHFDARLLSELDTQCNTLALLQTLPGVDLIGAAMLLVEIGTDMNVFGSADRRASWVGICPGNNESAGKRESGHVRKGNLYARRLLCEFAHAASRTTSVFKSKFQSLLRRGYKRSIIATATKSCAPLANIRAKFAAYSRNDSRSRR